MGELAMCNIRIECNWIVLLESRVVLSESNIDPPNFLKNYIQKSPKFVKEIFLENLHYLNCFRLCSGYYLNGRKHRRMFILHFAKVKVFLFFHQFFPLFSFTIVYSKITYQIYKIENK